MAYIGSRQALFKQAINNANNRLNVLSKEYNDFLQKIIDPASMSSWVENAGVVAGSAVYDLVMGAGKSLTGLISGLTTIGLELLNDGIRVLGTGDELAGWLISGRGQEFPPEVVEELRGLVSNFASNATETLVTTGINIAATGQNFVNAAGSLIVGENLGWQADWAPRAISNLAALSDRADYYATTGQRDPYKDQFKDGEFDPFGTAVEGALPLLNIFKTTEESTVLKDAVENRDKYRKWNDERRYALTEQAIRGTVAAKKWIDQTVFDTALDITGLGGVKDEAMRRFGQNELYQLLSGSMESIGAILAARGINTIARAYNIANPDAISSAYFGVQVFGNAYSQAIENGASLDDALTYGVSNALIETAIENLGGAKTDGILTGKGTAIKAFIKGFFEEGLEEVASEFTTPGFDFYAASPEEQKNFIFERMKTDTPDKQKEFLMRLFFTGISGGLTGGVLEGVNQFLFSKTFEGKAANAQASFKQNVEKVGEQKALSILKNQVNKFVLALNNKNLKGYIENERGDAVLKKLTRAEKLEKIRELGLEGIVTVKYDQEVKTAKEAQQALEDEAYTFSISPNVVFDKTIFQAGYGKKGKVSEEVLAINKGTRGAELETDLVGEQGVYDIVTREEANASVVGREALALADETSVPIAVVKTKDATKDTGDIAWYNSKNGVIYINQNANVSKETLRQEVLKHELVHAIARKNKALYNQIKKLVDEVVKITIAKDGKVSFDLNKGYNNGALYKYLEGKGNLSQKLTAALDDISAIYGQRIANIKNDIEVSTKPGETASLKRRLELLVKVVEERMAEEVVAYFVEVMVKDTNDFIRALEGKEQTLVEKFTEFFESDKKFEEFGDIGAKTRETIKKISKGIARGTREFVESRQRLEYFYRNYFGQAARYENYMAPEMLKKYGADKIIKALLDASRNGKGLSTIQIDGDYVRISEIFISEERPPIDLKKVDFQKRDLRAAFFNSWKFDEKKITDNTYARRLNAYAESIDAEIEEISLSLTNKDRTKRTYTRKDGTTYQSSEYDEAIRRKTVLQSRRLAAQLLQRDISLGLGIDKESTYSPTLTLADFIKNNNLQRASTLLKTSKQENELVYGDIFAQTNIREGVKLSAENKASLLKAAEFETESRMEKVKKIVVSKKEKTPEQIEIDKNVKVAAFRAAKRALVWIERHSPKQFGVDAGWSNKAYSSEGIDDIQGIYAEFDFSEQVSSITDIKDRVEAMKNKSEEFAALFSAFVGQKVLAKNGKTFTLGLENYDIEADVITNDKGLLSVVRVGIIPNKAYVESVIKEIQQEKQALAPEIEQPKPGLEGTLAQKNQKKLLDDTFKMISLPLKSPINPQQDFIKTLFSMNAGVDETLVKNKVKDAYQGLGYKVVSPNKFTFVERNTNNALLSPRQATFFRDVNKFLRDKEGRLRVYYHGTGAVFNEFSYKPMGAQGSASGFGFYFTDELDLARRYAGYNAEETGKLKKVYLNIKKPIDKVDQKFTDEEIRNILTTVLNSFTEFNENGITDEIKAAFIFGIPTEKAGADLFNKVKAVTNADQLIALLKETIGYSVFRGQEEGRQFVYPIAFIERLQESYELYKKLMKIKLVKNLTSEQMKEFIYINDNSTFNARSGAFRQKIISAYKEFVTKDQKELDVETGQSIQETLRLITKATGYDGVIDFESALTTVEGNNVLVAWFPEQIKSVDNLNPTISAEITEANIDENGQLVNINEMLQEVVYDKNSATLIIPNTELSYVVSSLNKAASLSPLVNIVLPANWSNSLELQKNIPDSLKIIEISRIGKGRLRANPQSTDAQEYNLILMKLANKTDESLFEFGDLKETRKSAERFTTNDLEIRFMNKRSAEDDAKVMDFFKDAQGNVSITLAVPFTGDVDYGTKYTNFNDIPAKGKFVVIKAVTPEAATFLNQIDFKRLSENSSVPTGRGFLGRDIIGEYNLIKRGAESEEYLDGVFKKVAPKTASSPASTQQRADIMRVFGDAVVRDMFEVDKKGNLVLKAKKIPESRASKNTIKLNGQTYSGDTYALYMPVDNPNNLDVSTVGKNDIAKLSELSNEMRAVYDFMMTTGIPFVMYKDPAGSLGFYWNDRNSYVSFINIAKPVDSKSLMKTSIHETYHNIFRNETRSAEEVSAQLALMMFEVDPATNTMGMSQAGKVFFDQVENAPSVSPNPYESYGFNLFLSRLQKTDSYKFMRKVGRDAREIFTILSTPNSTLFANAATTQEGYDLIAAKNEVTAQIVGYLFSDFEVFRKVFDADENLRVPMYEIYTKFLTDGNKYSTESSKKFMRAALQQYAEGFENLIKYLNTKYPNAEVIIQKDLNEFIKLFTEGKYTKKIDLIAAYLNERENKKRGEATRTLDKIVFLASIFAKTSTAARDNFNALVREMEGLIKNASYLLNKNRTDVTNIANPELPVFLERVMRKIKDFLDATEDGKIDIDRSGTKAQDPDKDYEIETLFTEIEEELTEFADKYEELDTEILNMFGLPSVQVVRDGIDNFLNSLDNGVKKMFDTNGGKWNSTYTLLVKNLFAQYNDKVMKPLSEFRSTIKVLQARAKPETTAGVLAGIINLRTTLQEKNIEILNIALKTRVKAAVDRLLAAPLQKDSPVSDVITKMNEIFGRMLDVTKDTTIEVGVMAQKLAEILSELVVAAEVAVQKNYDTDQEKEENLLMMVKRLATKAYKELALFGGNPAFLFNLPALDAAEANDIIGSIKPNDESDPRVFADAVAKMVRAFGTRYESSLGQDVTHNELAIVIAEEIKNFKKEKIDVDASTDNLWEVTTPQEFFRKLTKLFKGKVSLFERIWELYLSSSKRAEEILANFHREYTSFNKQNKGLQEYSYQDKIDVSLDFLVNIPSSDLEDLRQAVTEEIEAEKAEIKELRQKIKDNNAQKVPVQKQINALEKQKQLYQKGSIEWKNTQAQIRALNTQKRPFIDTGKQLSKEKKDKISSGKLLSFDERLRVKIAEYMADPENAKNVNQSMSRGEVISLYLSVSRELEMAEIEEKARANGEVNFINPTNHFKFGNQVNIFDNELLRKKGYEVAKDSTRPFTIFSLEKKELKAYLEGLLTDKDKQIIDFARNRFDQNYVLLNEEFEKRFKVPLPRQNIYIPFGTIESDYKREFDLKLANRYNVGVADGLVTETTTGATTVLKIENIYSVMENHTRSTARYSYERLITDFQNLLVNKSYFGTSLQTTITGVGNWLGDNNKFLKYFTSMFVDLLGYSDINETQINKVLKWAIRQNRARMLSFNLFSAIRQLGSIFTISIKNRANFLYMVKNLLSSAIFKDKYYKYLMENNANFYWRVQTGNIPDLARAIDTSLIIRASNFIDKINEIGTSPAARLDAAVLVATFKSFAEEIRKEDPTLSESMVLYMANERMEEVLLFGVANTNPAFRSHFSNSKRVDVQIFAKFQSENILQWGAIIRAWHGIQNKIPGSKDELLRAILSMLISAIYGASVSTASALALGYTDIDDALFEFIVNDFVWGNVVGSIPMVNQVTSLWQYDTDTIIRPGFEVTLPLLGEMFSIVEEFSYGLINKDTGEFNFRRAFKIFQEVLSPFGVPSKNIERIFRMVFNLTGALGDKTSTEISQWFAGQTDAQALTEAVKSGNRSAINNYVEEAFNNTRVQNEIVKLLANDSSLRLSLRDEDYFIDVQEDGTRKKVNIPSFKKAKYRRLQMAALMKMFTKGAYRKLSNKDKIRSIQRIINYYFNYMKAVILGDKKKDIIGTEGIDEVVERALTYEED